MVPIKMTVPYVPGVFDGPDWYLGCCQGFVRINVSQLQPNHQRENSAWNGINHLKLKPSVNIRANTASVTVGAIKKKKKIICFLFLAD